VTNERILCPSCPRYTKEINRSKGQKETVTIGVDLDIYITNYSGCGVDIAECPRCGKRFQISYKVDEIEQV